MTIRIIRGNALALPLADDSVDLVVTSPPYFGLRSYQDGGEHYDGQVGSEATPAEFVDALIAATREMVRVTKPTGSIWVNLGDRYAGSTGGSSGAATAASSGLGKTRGGSNPQVRAKRQPYMPSEAGLPKSLMGIPWRYAIRCIDELGLILRAEVIWDKPNGLPESVRDRVRRSHEQWFHFTLRPRYYSNVDEVREPHATEFLASGVRNPRHGRPGGMMPKEQRGEIVGDAAARTEAHGRDVTKRGVNYATASNPLGRLPGSVWTIATQPLRVPADLGIDHFAAFPMEWPRRIISGWCPPGGMVLDPFGGTGTTALVADVLGRDGISVDLSADYCRLARWRTADPKERARVLKKKPERAAPPPAKEETTLW